MDTQKLKLDTNFGPDMTAAALTVALRELGARVHENSRMHGFWEGPEQQSAAVKVALIHSEVSELLEALRSPGGGTAPCEKTVMVQKSTDDGVVSEARYLGINLLEEECADIIIRVLDLAERLGLDLGKAIIAKHNYNCDRPMKHSGKRF